MQYSLLIASIAVFAAAVPMDMKTMKQATDAEYGAYGEYAKYADYDKYPQGAEHTVKMMGKHLSSLYFCTNLN
jgi:hypothetical protein